MIYQVYYRKKPIPAPHWVYIYVRQARALFIKNWVLTLRNKKALVIQLLGIPEIPPTQKKNNFFIV